jgi:hypothetical protein
MQSKKLWFALLPVLSFVPLALGGCDAWSHQKYFTYCDDTGCYTCNEQGCTPSAGPTTGSCRAASDCAEGCYCDARTGKCVEAGFCDVAADCGQGMACNVARHSCEPSAGGTGCKADTDCATGQKCMSGTCVASAPAVCTKDTDCAAGQTCTGGTCTAAPPATCAKDADCAKGSYCSTTGSCTTTAACQSDADCAALGANFGCDLTRNTCVPRAPTGAACKADCDCAQPGQICSNGTCVPKTLESALMCVFNNECGVSGECVNSMCHRACTSDANCGTGDTCQAGFCFANPKPVGGCVYNADCKTGQVCVNGACHAGCQSDTDCTNPVDFCDHNLCQPDWRKVPQCRIDADCPTAGNACVNAVCRTHCWSDSDCGSCQNMPVCSLGYCMAQIEVSPMCKVQSDCSAGLSCVNASCK